MVANAPNRAARTRGPGRLRTDGPTDAQVALARALRRRIRMLDLTNDEIAARTGLATRTVRRCLTGHPLTWPAAEALCEAVGWTVLDALREDERRERVGPFRSAGATSAVAARARAG